MKVLIVTGSRADWNGLGMVGHALRTLGVTVEVIAIGQHADSESSMATIIEDGFDPALMKTNVRDDMALGCGTACVLLGAANIQDFDLALICGDRFEILGAACALASRNIPIAHIGGGDTTEGSIDNKYRYAITAMADLHFVTNVRALGTLIHHQGISGSKVWNLGNPALDRICWIDKDELFAELGAKERQYNVLVCYHPATKGKNPLVECYEILRALKAWKNLGLDVGALVIGTNADKGWIELDKLLRSWVEREKDWAYMRDNLSPRTFHSCLEHFDLMIGNSSAGLIETAQHGTPVINVGDRQRGRMSPANVIHCKGDSENIYDAILDRVDRMEGRFENPYGDGQSAAKIAKIIVDQIGARKS